jgi:hypothetical protein
VHISGAPRKGWCKASRPTYFSAHIDNGTLSAHVGSGTCKSIKQALDKVSSIDVKEKIRILQRLGMHEQRAQTVFREEADGSITPFISLFANHWHNPDFLPSGRYVGFRWDVSYDHNAGQMSHPYVVMTTIDRTFAGYGSRTQRAPLPVLTDHVMQNLVYETANECEGGNLRYEALSHQASLNPVVLGKRRPSRKKEVGGLSL